MVRFLLRAFGADRSLVLVPEDATGAEALGVIAGQLGRYVLPAPIIKVTVQDIMDDVRMEQLRLVFESWVRVDQENCDLARRGLLRFRIPLPYKTNEMPNGSVYEMGVAATPDESLLHPGILALAEDAECLGGQFFRRGDGAGALRSLMLVHHVWKKYPEVFQQYPRWRTGLPADLGVVVNQALNDAKGKDRLTSRWEALEELTTVLDENPVVKRFYTESSEYLSKQFKKLE